MTEEPLELSANRPNVLTGKPQAGGRKHELQVRVAFLQIAVGHVLVHVVRWMFR